ncbi:ABC-three component system protein [Neorhizobium sp. T25_27]|uniref:ABC-three component system protein n=1 Tax=Neorhizobium sp. T25_27 TaxID=2093831 RepID=UPI000CF98D61|nr:ABC-three component system protein [Neorhizobium sp. T25_27]
MPFNEDRYILNLQPPELEDLVKKWLARLKSDYVDFEQVSKSADMGRDAVGFLSQARYDEEWHNYQCKQLSKPLGKGRFVLELGKIFHYHCAGEFTLPTKYIFVAPNGGVGDVKKLIARPSKIASYLIDHWDEYCLDDISDTVPSPLTDEIRAAIAGYDFSNVDLWKASELVERPQMRAVMMDHMDIDPGEAPTLADEDVPIEAAEFEYAYVSQLVGVFGEHRGIDFADLTAVISDPEFGPQMALARRRYLEHRLFGLHYRDSLFEKYILQVDRDVHDRVVDHYYQMNRGPKYDRLAKLMSEASAATVSGPFGKHNRVTASVRQGACHHFANTGKMPWK